ncbi:NrsF family protein [Paragemmobacter ruber]|uniref:DUF1109 family protein n=1 Tax=Paragemmobacter ruber TaxID=1985673 RepID=A0ABW9Y5K3_9RHOB|nr:NrsF family protein [Rhodobacter ruber]NBE07683.1 DUF1109 family protein [Rhodobacter ruber]
MKTEDLISILAADATPDAPLRPGQIAAASVLAVVVVVGLFLSLIGVRPALAQALLRPEVAAKAILPLLTCVLVAPVALRQLRPGAAGLPAARLLVPLSLAVGLWLWAFMAVPAPLRFAEWMPSAVVECLGLILLLSLVPLWLVLRMMGRGASTAPARAGALAGLAVGCGVAAGYSLFCTKDNPIFYVTFYGAAIGLVTGLGAIAGRRVLRW